MHEWSTATRSRARTLRALRRLVQLRKDINSWVAKYRRDTNFSGKPSYRCASTRGASTVLARALWQTPPPLLRRQRPALARQAHCCCAALTWPAPDALHSAHDNHSHAARSNTYSALNALAGHYNSFGPTAPIPKKRLDRLTKVRSGCCWGEGVRLLTQQAADCVRCCHAFALPAAAGAERCRAAAVARPLSSRPDLGGGWQFFVLIWRAAGAAALTRKHPQRSAAVCMAYGSSRCFDDVRRSGLRGGLLGPGQRILRGWLMAAAWASWHRGLTARCSLPSPLVNDRDPACHRLLNHVSSRSRASGQRPHRMHYLWRRLSPARHPAAARRKPATSRSLSHTARRHTLAGTARTHSAICRLNTAVPSRPTYP